MELKKLYDIFSITNQSQREDLLRCVPKDYKTIFCSSLVNELANKSIRTDSNVQHNFVDHCGNKLSKFIDNNLKLEKVRIAASWMKNRNISFEAAINSSEGCWAYEILIHNDFGDQDAQIAGEFLRMAILLLDVKICSYGLFIQKLLELEVLLLSNMSVEKAKVLTQIFTCLADKIFQLKIECPNDKSKILNMLLTCANFKELCEIQFPFWKKLPGYLKSSRTYEQYIEEFILKLAPHCRIIDNIEMETNLNSSLMVFREHVSEIIQESESIINVQRLLDFFFYMMQINSSNDFEVCLFIIASIAKKVRRCDDGTVPNIIEFVLKIDERSHGSILAMSAKLMGQFACYISSFHSIYLVNVLNFLKKIVNMKTSASSAAFTSLGKIFSACSSRMEPYLNEVMEIYRNLNHYFIHSKAKLEIVKGITHIACSLQEPRRSECLNYLCYIQFDRILKAPTVENVNEQLDYLMEIYHNLTIEGNAFDLILAQHWPVISNMLDFYQANCEVMTGISECIECAVPHLSLSALPLLDQIGKKFLFYFGATQNGFLLRALNSVADKIGNDENCKEGLLTIFEGVTVLTFNALHDEKKMNFEIIDEYFFFASIYFKKLTVNILKCPLIIQIIELSIELCKMNKKSSNRYVLEFLTCIFACNPSHPDIKLCVEQSMTLFGDAVVATLLESSIFLFDATLITNVVDIFDAFKAQSNIGFEELLTKALQMMPRKNNAGVVKIQDEDVTKFAALMKKEKLPKADMISGIVEFRKIVRA